VKECLILLNDEGLADTLIIFAEEGAFLSFPPRPSEMG
jgi:hypothetical protein